jgi:hypothetical protein
LALLRDDLCVDSLLGNFIHLGVKRRRVLLSYAAEPSRLLRQPEIHRNESVALACLLRLHTGGTEPSSVLENVYRCNSS